MQDSSSPFNTIDDAIDAIGAGRMVIVTDDQDRENEGDLVLAAEKATSEHINVMIRHARGLVCVPTTAGRLAHLGIQDMVPRNREALGTAFTASVDAARGITTGISAHDRALTIRLLAAPDSAPEHFVQPGHVFPLKARPGGVLERAGHTEAALDLVTLAGLQPCGVICEILNEDGTMARLPELLTFAKRFQLPIVSVAQLIEYRLRQENLVQRLASGPLQTEYGTFALHVYGTQVDGRRHAALTLGEIDDRPTLVRVHSGNLLEDLFRATGSARTHRLALTLQAIANEGRGILVYLQPENAWSIATEPPKPLDERSSPAIRTHGIGAQILRDLGAHKLRLLTSSPRRVVGLQAYDLEIVEQLSLP